MPSPSSVVTAPLTSATGSTQERTACAVDVHGAGAALAEPAAEARALQREVVAQHVEQRGVGIDVDRARLPLTVRLKVAISPSL